MDNQHEQVRDPGKIQEKVQELYADTGNLLTELEAPALLVDALCKDCPIVGASRGFCHLTGYDLDHCLGKNCRMLLQGIPTTSISRSSRKNLQDFCAMCRVKGITNIAEVTCIAANSRRDGSHFMNLFMLGLCKVKHHIFILGVQMSVGEGLFVRVTQPERKIEACRNMFREVRDHLYQKTSDDPLGLDDHRAMSRQVTGQPDFGFFDERLQDHCLLTNNGYTVIRREPEAIANNCLVFGDRPLRHTREGLCFAMHVDEVVHNFDGLPLLGFTKQCPKDGPDLYPGVSRCLASSVLIGACGEAFARDQTEHFVLKFKQPSKEQVQQWSLDPSLPPHKRTAPVKLQRGDVLTCKYLRNGHLILELNEEAILDFDLERPVDETVNYYAVVDVCLSAYSLTLVPSAKDAPQDDEDMELSEQEAFKREVSFSPEDAFYPMSNASAVDLADIEAKVTEILVQQSLKDVVKACNFMVTIADPRSPDCPLIAVSKEFLSMTGYDPGEVIGVNCRFLNQGCDMEPAMLMNLRVCVETGEPFTAVLPNRKKSGELFLNLLDLRGLTVAKNPDTGENLWFLIGVQADVTDVADGEIPTDHWSELQSVADAIRSNIVAELAKMAVDAAISLPPLEATASQSEREGAWSLLHSPSWMQGARLGEDEGSDPHLSNASSSGHSSHQNSISTMANICFSRTAIFSMSAAVVLVSSAWIAARRRLA
jgi:PAS domain-containing protein